MVSVMRRRPVVLNADDLDRRSTMPFDVAATRAQFPSLASGIAHFDGPGGTQAPAVVGAAIARTLTGPLSNRGIGVASEQNAEDTIRAFRTALADLLGASPAGIVYGRSATQIAYDFSRHLAKTWAPGDEVVVTQLDHDANVRPWIQAAVAAGVTVRSLRTPAAAPDRGRPGDIPQLADRPLGGGGPHADPLPHLPQQGRGRCLPIPGRPRRSPARDVLAPAGTFYAYEPFRALNLEVDAGLRVGLAPYNDDSEIDRLLSAFEEFMHSH